MSPFESRPTFKIQAIGRKFTAFPEEEHQQWTTPFCFVQAADTQLGMQAKTIEGLETPTWEKEVQWAKTFVREVNDMTPRPEFVTICGDLLDAFPEDESHLRKAQEKDFKEIFAKLEVPLVCVCGNHDIGNTPSYESVSKYRSEFGDDFFSFWCRGVFFLVLNSQYYEDASKVRLLKAEHETWLEEQLSIAQRRQPKHIIVLQHIPYFLHSPTEPKQYFNFEPELRLPLIQRLRNAGVSHVFSGHYHRNAGGTFGSLEQVVTSAVGAQLGNDGNGFRFVKVFQNEISHQYYKLGTSEIDLRNTRPDLTIIRKTSTSNEAWVSLLQEENRALEQSSYTL